MAVTVSTTPAPALIELLTRSHMPYALPLLRRFRFMGFPGGCTENTRILWSSRLPVEEHLDDGIETPFVAAYLDFSRGPETELWIYASAEARLLRNASEKGWDEGEFECLDGLLRAVKSEQDAYFVPGSEREADRETRSVLIGNLNEVVREGMVERGVRVVSTGLYNKWVFRVEGLPDVGVSEKMVGGNMWEWDVVRREDIGFTISRTPIQRKERTMKLLPSTALYLDGKPIAWAFLGPDSSLSSLHCEEPYRGRGIAKAVAVKLLRDRIRDYGNDGYAWADVAPDNLQSSGVCKSLNGEVKWQISWSLLDLYESYPDV